MNDIRPVGINRHLLAGSVSGFKRRGEEGCGIFL